MDKLGREAIVIGSGIGGLLAARVLSDHFERVSILERDAVGDTREARAGVPQGKHLHALLVGGQRVLDDLFPGFEEDLDRVGAARLRAGLDLRVERPGFDPFPQRDLGLSSAGLTRPQLEFCVRRRVLGIANVHMEGGCRVMTLLPGDDRRSIAGLQYKHDGRSETRAADLVVDASGSGDLTLAALAATDHASPRETTIGVDLGYSSAVLAIPDGTPTDWRGVMHLPDAPKTSRGALMMPVEGNRWMLALGGRPGEHPPADEEGFRAYAATLRTTTIARAIAPAKLVTGIERFRFNESRLRHFDEMQTFPGGLLPLGDAICRFNPVFGQGMSVAAQQAHAFGQLLARSMSGELPLRALWHPFFARVAAIVDTPWALAAIPDFIFPQTRGERPPDFEMSLQFGTALNRAAAKHADIHKVAAEVQHLLRPRSALMDRQFIERIMSEMSNSTS
jgi:2-polyprenyl-6-methoxyphenol hydroxylase-like FAD-dependent oxidoreductase